MPGAKLHLRPLVQFRGVMRHHRRDERCCASGVVDSLQQIANRLFDGLKLRVGLGFRQSKP